ncbi:hypothetical protein BJV82DRAFT_193392 [Fennellomyces sp. T-0311]|nr:hypothetical protein BJV82DRAFT_193392 [Fennellomyces sp. T-0311]
MFSTLSLVDDDGAYGPACSGCNNNIEEGSVIAFGDALFHLQCFKCAKCCRPANCESNLLLLSDGRPVCEGCSYNCYVCKQVIRDEAIMTGEEAYHASCFRCVSCKRRIEDLVFTQTTKGIYCTPCHEKRKLERQKRKEEKERRKQQQYNLSYATKSLPSIPSGFQSPTNATNLPLPTPRPGALNERPYMANRHASRLFDADAVSNYMETEHYQQNRNVDPPTPVRSRSSSVDNVSHKRTIQPTPSRSAGLSSPPNSGKRLSVIPDREPNEDTSSSAKTLDMALPEIPSLNFSYFDNDSDDLLNLTKDLGATLFSSNNTNEKLQQEAAEALSSAEESSSSSKITQASHVLSTSLTVSSEPASNLIDDLPDNVAQLKSQLQLSKRKLADTEANFQKIKEASKRALDEFQNAKEEFAKENSIRRQHEKTIQELRQQITMMLQAQQKDPESFVVRARRDIERLANMRAQLEHTCEELKGYRTVLSNQEEAGLSAVLNTEIESLRNERNTLRDETKELTKLRDDVISEMIMLNTKNAELSTMNNDLSRRVTEREREAAAVMAGTNFIRRGSEETTGKVVSRDSFNGTQAPKVFKIKTKKFFKKSSNHDQPWASSSGSSSSTLSLKSRHAFQPTSFIRPTRCDVCNDKVWGRSDLRCQGCGFITHGKCLINAPQVCVESRSNSLDDIGSNASLFGVELSEQVVKEDRPVPRVVEQCIEAVEARGMDYEGIYRKSGGAAQMRTIQRAFEKDLPLDLDDDEEFNDICAVTSVLKHYFRKLPNPLLTYELYSKWIEVGTMEPGQTKHDAVMSVLQQLPKANYDTLKMLILHLHRVREQSGENLMTTKNLAVVFAPTLMRDHDATRDLLDMSYKNATLEYLINKATDLFP